MNVAYYDSHRVYGFHLRLAVRNLAFLCVESGQDALSGSEWQLLSNEFLADKRFFS